MNRNARVARILESAGVRTTIGVPQGASQTSARLRQVGCEVAELPLSRLRRTRNPGTHARYLLNLRSQVAHLANYISENQVDVVLINGTANPHGAIAAKQAGVPVVWQMLDTFPPTAYLMAAMPYILRRSTVLMTNGMSVAAAHPGALAFEGPLYSFGPCVPVDLFSRVEKNDLIARQELGILQDSYVIGNINNVNPMKGHDTFLRAAGLAKRQYARCGLRRPLQFLILGADGPEDHMRRLREIARQEGIGPEDLVIRNAGERVHHLAQAMDLFWLTSRPKSEGMSNSLAEAQCLGVPAIAMRTGAVHETISDGVTGHLVPNGNVDQLVQLSINLLLDSSKRLEMGQRAADHVRTNFGSETVANTHLAAYKDAVRIGPRR